MIELDLNLNFKVINVNSLCAILLLQRCVTDGLGNCLYTTCNVLYTECVIIHCLVLVFIVYSCGTSTVH